MIERNNKIIFESFLPEQNQYKLARAYGISRERVRQIFNKEIKGDYKPLKKALMSFLKCRWCGKVLGMKRGKRLFCDSSHKLQFYNYLDPHKCTECKEYFLHLRNNYFKIEAEWYC